MRLNGIQSRPEPSQEEESLPLSAIVLTFLFGMFHLFMVYLVALPVI
jgi:hypothetical protein